jgi:hypothetical protein
MRDLRRAILHLQDENAAFLRGEALNDSLTAPQKKVAQSYTAANQLQWEIGEQDANNAPRSGSLIASNQDELGRILKQISSKK